MIGATLHFTFGLPRGADGGQGPAGSNGTNGNDGSPGATGPQGPPFANAVVDWVTTLNPGDNATLGNTRAVVRYLARYTSRIAMSNARLVSVDAEKREVTFRWKDYRAGGQVKERTLSGKRFIWLFTRHLVPKGYRRVRYFGWLAGGQAGLSTLKEGRPGAIGERVIPSEKPACQCCQAREWVYVSFFIRLPAPCTAGPVPEAKERFSLVGQRAGP